MLTIDIPGFRRLQLRHLVLDYNGTVACDGALITGVSSRLEQLSHQLEIHVLTADTFGTVAGEIAALPCRLSIIPPHHQAQAKMDYVVGLGPDQVVGVGNGRNDQLMLGCAALGLAVIQCEGASALTLQRGDVVVTDILAALDLLLNPRRLIATLRG